MPTTCTEKVGINGAMDAPTTANGEGQYCLEDGSEFNNGAPGWVPLLKLFWFTILVRRDVYILNGSIHGKVDVI